jgi:hypothetical protein
VQTKKAKGQPVVLLACCRKAVSRSLRAAKRDVVWKETVVASEAHKLELRRTASTKGAKPSTSSNAVGKWVCNY